MYKLSRRKRKRHKQRTTPRVPSCSFLSAAGGSCVCGSVASDGIIRSEWSRDAPLFKSNKYIVNLNRNVCV